VNSKISEWMKSQSDVDDAILYLIEKEIYEHKNRDLSYIVPRYRNEAYFDELFSRGSKRLTSRPLIIDSVDEKDIDYVRSRVIRESVREAHNHVPNELELLREKKFTSEPDIPEEDYTAGNVTRINSVLHTGNVEGESIIMTEAKERDFSKMDLTCYDD